MKCFSLCIILVVSLSQASYSQVSREKIFLNYTKPALDSAYDQGPWAPNTRAVLTQVKSLNEYSRSRIGEPRRIKYGSTDVEQLDLYAAKQKNAPVHIHIHGGAWRTGNGSGEQAYNARKFVELGVMYVAPDYQLVNASNKSLYPMVEQVINAVVWTYQNAVKYGGDPDKIYLSGHSAGAHLAGVLVTTDWTKYGLPPNVIKGAFLCSGMYDLYPVSLSSRNQYVTFTDQMVKDLSPMNHIDRINAPIILAYGTNESPEFKRQSQEFAEALKKQGKQVELHVLNGYNHFELMIALGNPYDIPGEIMIRQVKKD